MAPRKAAERRRRDQRYTHDIVRAWRNERPDIVLDDFLLELYLLRVGDELDRAQARTSLEWFGLRHQDMRVLFALRRSGPPYALRPTDLFRSILVSSAAITKQVARLLDAGLVRRTNDREHRGGFLIHLTAKGRKLADNAVERYASEPHFLRAYQSLTPRERAAGERFLKRLLDELEHGAETA